MLLKNCHIDNRWVVKLTGYGMTQLLLPSYKKNQIVFTGQYNQEGIRQPLIDYTISKLNHKSNNFQI